jgi:single-strand DNA-binding protein
MSYQKWIGEGHLGSDCEMRLTSQTGKSVSSFSLAIDSGAGDKKSTLWFRVTAWEKLAELISDLKKGAHVLVEGRVEQSRAYTAKNGEPGVSMEITAVAVRFLDKRSDNGNGDEAPAPRTERPTTQTAPPVKREPEVDIPF